MLRHQSRLLREEAARPFFFCLAELARGRHMIALLENVLGLLRVWPQVRRALDRLKPYGYFAAKATCQQLIFFVGVQTLGIYIIGFGDLKHVGPNSDPPSQNLRW